MTSELKFTQDQEEAIVRFNEFMLDDTATAFLLEGGAGVGKTFLVSQLLHNIDGQLCVCTPTHKATNVVRRKLDVAGLDWCRGYDAWSYGGEVVTGTTAQLLGISPVIADDQSAEVKFGKSGKGLLTKFVPRLLVVDEVSMLGWPDFADLLRFGQGRGMKILAVGDAGQLPPVKQQRIPFERFKHSATLRQIVRQAEGSAIVELAWAIRDGKSWADITGRGVVRESNVGGAFLEAVQLPGERPEEEREVFIAYRNATVNAAQEAACQKLYGHGRLTFAPGEMVLSTTNFYRSKTLLCANQDELMVEAFHEEDADPTTGIPVTLRHRRGGVNNVGTFRANYLSPEALADKQHPYNVELKEREENAKELQDKFNNLPRGAPDVGRIDAARRKAWVDFFEWRDQTIISFHHPFAITSHKSQGSTYRACFVSANDFANFGSHGLYVAVTRPKELLVVP